MPSSRRPFRLGRSRTGLGLFATAPIRKGALIVHYTGRRITNEEADKLDNRYLYELNSRWAIDGKSRRNIARYINHGCRPNAESDVVRGKIVIRAIRNIKPGDEITYNYGRDHFTVYIKPKGCRCTACLRKRREERAARRRARLRAMRRAQALRTRRRADSRARRARAPRRRS